MADEEADVVPEDGCVAVQEVAGQLHHDGQLRQLLQDLSGLQGGRGGGGGGGG